MLGYPLGAFGTDYWLPSGNPVFVRQRNPLTVAAGDAYKRLTTNPIIPFWAGAPEKLAGPQCLDVRDLLLDTGTPTEVGEAMKQVLLQSPFLTDVDVYLGSTQPQTLEGVLTLTLLSGQQVRLNLEATPYAVVLTPIAQPANP